MHYTSMNSPRRSNQQALMYRFLIFHLALFATGDHVFSQTQKEHEDAPGQKRADPAVQLTEHLRKVQSLVKSKTAEAEKNHRKYQSVQQQSVAKQLAHASVPIIVGQSWDTVVSPAGAINYSIDIYNPDSLDRSSIYAYVFVGPGNIVPDVGAALATADSRFSRLIMPADPGVTIPAGGYATLSYVVQVSASVERTNYILNAFLFELTYSDIGPFLGRSAVIFNVR